VPEQQQQRQVNPEQRQLRMAGGSSLETGASMTPVTTTEHAEGILGTVSQMKTIKLPGKERELHVQAPTEFGPLDIHVEGLTDPTRHPARWFGMMMGGSLRKQDLLTANPESFGMLQELGPHLKGVAHVSFDWNKAAPEDQYRAPEQGLGAGRSRSVLTAVKDVYQNEVIPRLLKMNPGSALLLASSPALTEGRDPLRRGRLYQRTGMMGPVDLHMNQYSLILPSGKVHPLELFGGAPRPVL
jgi:hypothetical protein